MVSEICNSKQIFFDCLSLWFLNFFIDGFWWKKDIGWSAVKSPLQWYIICMILVTVNLFSCILQKYLRNLLRRSRRRYVIASVILLIILTHTGKMHLYQAILEKFSFKVSLQAPQFQTLYTYDCNYSFYDDFYIFCTWHEYWSDSLCELKAQNLSSGGKIRGLEKLLFQWLLSVKKPLHRCNYEPIHYKEPHLSPRMKAYNWYHATVCIYLLSILSKEQWHPDNL